MTTIAWDGEVLAGDRRAHISLTPTGRVRKVHKVMAPNGRYALVGFAGSMAYATAYLQWLRGAPQPERAAFVSSRWNVLMIDDRRQVYYRCNETDSWDLLGRVRWSIGSGAWIALGAMEFGATAAQAVRLASRIDLETGGGVNVVSFR